MQHRNLLRLRFLGWHQVQPYALEALVSEVQGLGSAVGEIDDAAGNDRTAVIDPHVDPTPVTQVRDTDPAAQRQGRVRGGQIVHIVGLATGGGSTLEIGSVPGSGTDLVGRVVFGPTFRSRFYVFWGSESLGIFRP